MEIPYFARVILYADISALALVSILIFVFQWNVFKGRPMPNPDGTVDDWHEQKLLYGMALADLVLAVPVTLIGVALIFSRSRIGYYLTGLTAYWFLWTNIAFTVTSLKFENPKITLKWLIVFPLGAFLGLVYLIWSLVFFDQISLITR